MNKHLIKIVAMHVVVQVVVIIGLASSLAGAESELVIPATHGQVMAFRKLFNDYIKAEKCQYDAIGIFKFVDKWVNKPGQFFRKEQITDIQEKISEFNVEGGLLAIAEAVRLGYGFDRGVCTNLKVEPREMQSYRDALGGIGQHVRQSHYQATPLHVFTTADASNPAIAKHLAESNALMYKSANPAALTFIYAQASIANNLQLEEKSKVNKVGAFHDYLGILRTKYQLTDGELDRLQSKNRSNTPFSSWLLTTAITDYFTLPAQVRDADAMLTNRQLSYVEPAFRQQAIAAVNKVEPGQKYVTAASWCEFAKITNVDVRQQAISEVNKAMINKAKPEQILDMALAWLRLSWIDDVSMRQQAIAAVNEAELDHRFDMAQAWYSLSWIKDATLLKKAKAAVNAAKPGQKDDIASAWHYLSRITAVSVRQSAIEAVNAAPIEQKVDMAIEYLRKWESSQAAAG